MSLKNLKLQRVIQEFRHFDQEMQIQAILSFLFIAHREGEILDTTVTDLRTALNMSSASASRNVALLAHMSRKGTHGHKLITAIENPERRNEKHLRLTPKGKDLIKRLEDHI